MFIYKKQFLVFAMLLPLAFNSNSQNWIIPGDNTSLTSVPKIGITGIGTSLPLQIVADNNSEIQFFTGNPTGVKRMSIDKNGTLSIGTTEGTSFTNTNLIINTRGGGYGYQGGSIANSAIYIQTQFPNTNLSIGCGGEGNFYIGNKTSPSPILNLYLDVNTTVSGTFNAQKNVIIGNPTSFTQGFPDGYKLYVSDGILAEKFKCAIKTTANWPDFVFAPEYKLRSLDEIGKFINENNRLPGVPSAEDVVKEGIDLGKMDALLLQKIEELTLYLLDMKKENDLIKKQLLNK